MASLSSHQITALVEKVKSALSRLYQDTPLSTIQERSLRQSGIKGPVWVSHAVFPAPEAEDGDICNLVDSAIRFLGRGDDQYTIPTISDVKVEWTGHRPDASSNEVLHPTTEKEKFNTIDKHVQNQTTIVYVYGGSFCLHSPAVARPIVSKLVEQTGSRCCTIGYRLAPQNPFPSALIDVLQAYLCLLYPPPNSYHSPIPAGTIVFVGESSGAALILSLVQLILAARQVQSTDVPTVRYHSATVPIPMPAGLAIISPAGDQAIALPSWQANAFDIFDRDTSPLTSETYPSCRIWPTDPPRGHVYCDTSMLCHPLVSPAAARNWIGSPPIWLSMGQERLADSGKVVAQTAARQGVVVLWEMYERMPHNWIMMLPKLWQSDDCVKRCAEMIRMMADNRVTESGGEFVTITGERKRVHVEQLTDLTADKVEELMRANTKNLKPWTGGSRSNSKL